MAGTNAAARSCDWTLLLIDAVIGGGGLYFVLVGAGVLPLPSRTPAPGWIIMCCGLVFFAAGIAVLVRGWLGLDDKVQELPEETPAAIKAVYSLAGLTAVASLAGLGTWVAFGTGPREFSISVPIAGLSMEVIGRAAFGIGAIITWLMVAVMAHASARSIFGKKGGAK
jgi:hypothetical protein